MPRFGEWKRYGDALYRDVYRPGAWLKPGEPIPTCPACGAPFKKENDIGGMTYYAAACMKRHDPDIN